MNRRKKMMLNITRNIVAWIITITMLIPIMLVFINSVKSKGESAAMNFAIPQKIMWENYATVIEQGKLVQSFFNSMLYSVASVILIILLASMTAFVLSRNKTKINRVFYTYIVLGLTLTINHIGLITIMKSLGLIDTRLGIIILYVALQLPFAIFLISSFISTIPRELDEAAIIDGCGPFRLFFEIIFPMLKPAVISVGILNFLNTWNEFILPLYYLNDSMKWPMTNSIYSFYGLYNASWHLVCSDIVLTSIPVIIIYLLGQKYIVSGLTAGAVKG